MDGLPAQVVGAKQKIMVSGRLQRAISEIDAANAFDPTRIADAGANRPAALVYGERMSAVLKRFCPDAGELLCLAARAQHIQRWTIPRQDYRMDRAGYLQWRNHLKQRHAKLAGAIMARCGYGDVEIARVQSLLRKENLKRDTEAQAIEDVACIVFLEFYSDDFAAKHDEEKVIGILRKTWTKMSGSGRDHALALPLSPRVHRLIGAALVA